MEREPFVTYKHFIATILSLAVIAFSVLAYISPIGRAEYEAHIKSDAQYKELMHDKLLSIDRKMDTLLSKVGEIDK